MGLFKVAPNEWSGKKNGKGAKNGTACACDFLLFGSFMWV